MTTNAIVLTYLRNKGYVTNKELIFRKIYRFAARIYDLKNIYGIKIRGEHVPNTRDTYKYILEEDNEAVVIEDGKIIVELPPTQTEIEQFLKDLTEDLQKYNKPSIWEKFKSFIGL